MTRWLVGAALVVILSVVLVAVLGSRDDDGAPDRVVDAARQALSCPGAPPGKIRCEPIPLDRWRCTGGGGHVDIADIDTDHPEVSVIC